MVVQLKGLNNQDVSVDSVLCHLMIYSNYPHSYYNYSFIPTDFAGRVCLTKEDIIQNTELKNCYCPRTELDMTAVKFEFRIIHQSLIDYALSGLEPYVNKGLGTIEDELCERGFNESDIDRQSPIIIKKQQEDRGLYELLVKSRNKELVYSDTSKVVGSWHAEKDYAYTLDLV